MNLELNPKSESISSVDKQLASLYAEVFGAEPWNEAWRCPACNIFYGPEYSENTPSPCCSAPLTIAYPEEETIDYIKQELSQPRAQIKLFSSKEEKLAGFAWGYQIPNAELLAAKKWPQSTKVQEKVVQTISRYVYLDFPLYYISEVGVSPEFRGNRIGFQLTQSLLDYGVSLGEAVVFRTNWSSPMMRIATRLEMTQIMGPKIKVVNDKIVKTNEIAGFMDEINSDRTLFIKLPSDLQLNKDC